MLTKICDNMRIHEELSWMGEKKTEFWLEKFLKMWKWT